MNSARSDRLPRELMAQAAAWLARLRSEDRTAEDAAGFRAWLDEDARHVRAFDLVTLAWDSAGSAGDHDRQAPARAARPKRRMVLAGAVAVLLAGGGWWLQSGPQSYVTEIGEMRRIALADGSSVLLDADTRITVDYSDDKRAIRLERGRAHFDVASDPLRAFVVTADTQQVIAIGTAFDVSLRNRQVAVVLQHGRVAVQGTADPGKPAFRRMMAPGDRLVLRAGSLALKDQPDLVKANAWQSGRVVFDGVPLSEAVAEMNRYSRRELAVDPQLGRERISGVYSTADIEEFARSVAVLLDATVQSSDTIIHISPLPERPAPAS